MKGCLKGCLIFFLIIIILIAGLFFGLEYFCHIAPDGNPVEKALINWSRSMDEKELKKIESAPSKDGIKTGRTRIVNGEIIEWAEKYRRDNNIKPFKVEYFEDGTENHNFYYNVDGKIIRVFVKGRTATRDFYENDNWHSFAGVAQILDSNEGILNKYAANMRLNEKVKKMYK